MGMYPENYLQDLLKGSNTFDPAQTSFITRSYLLAQAKLYNTVISLISTLNYFVIICY